MAGFSRERAAALPERRAVERRFATDWATDPLVPKRDGGEMTVSPALEGQFHEEVRAQEGQVGRVDIKRGCTARSTCVRMKALKTEWPSSNDPRYELGARRILSLGKRILTVGKNVRRAGRPRRADGASRKG